MFELENNYIIVFVAKMYIFKQIPFKKAAVPLVLNYLRLNLYF